MLCLDVAVSHTSHKLHMNGRQSGPWRQCHVRQVSFRTSKWLLVKYVVTWPFATWPRISLMDFWYYVTVTSHIVVMWLKVTLEGILTSQTTCQFCALRAPLGQRDMQFYRINFWNHIMDCSQIPRILTPMATSRSHVVSAFLDAKFLHADRTNGLNCLSRVR